MPCMRVYIYIRRDTSSQGAVQCSLGSSNLCLMVLLKSLAARIGSYGGLQCHMRCYTDTQGAAP